MLGDITGTLYGDVSGADSVILVDSFNNKLSTGLINIEGSRISSSSDIEIGDPAGSASTTLAFNQVDANASLLIKNISSGSLGSVSKVTFAGYGSSLTSPTNLSAGDYLGITSYNAYNSTNSQLVPAGLMLYRVDPTGSVGTSAADGKVEIVTSTHTQTLKFLTFDSKGQLAVNQQTAQATVDINGVMRLVKQTAAPASPVEGMIAVADRVTWDPASKGSGGSYPVYYNGTTWTALF